MKKILIMMLQLFVLIVTCYATLVNAGEWNEKPVMCASKEETFGVINCKETSNFTFFILYKSSNRNVYSN